MGDKTPIQWTHATWNPVVGCSVVSPGCANCYAMKMAARLDRMGQERYAGLTRTSKAGAVWTGKLALAPEHTLTQPLRWSRPRLIFVNSMSDLFHESVPDGWIDEVFAVMALAPQHTFQLLTKRSTRMREYCSDPAVGRRIGEAVCEQWGTRQSTRVVLIAPGQDENAAPPGPRVYLGAWPLPNVWPGVSAEDQTRADERVPDLLATPAAVRFVSAEPLLGRIDFRDYLKIGACRGCGFRGSMGDAFPRRDAQCPACGVISTTLDWIIVGGESGPGARPMHPAWARSIRDQCAAAGVAFFFKQWGAWHADALLYTDVQGRCPPPEMNIGKKAAGRLLDGREHNDMPGGGVTEGRP